MTWRLFSQKFRHFFVHFFLVSRLTYMKTFNPEYNDEIIVIFCVCCAAFVSEYKWKEWKYDWYEYFSLSSIYFNNNNNNSKQQKQQCFVNVFVKLYKRGIPLYTLSVVEFCYIFNQKKKWQLSTAVSSQVILSSGHFYSTKHTICNIISVSLTHSACVFM